MKKRVCASCGAEVEPVCPTCQATLTKLPTKPRDLGLLLHVLCYRVPLDAELTEYWIEKARTHSKMSPERLVTLRANPHTRHWRYLLEKRARRLAWSKEHNCPPPYGWTPPAAGEPDHENALDGMRLHRHKIRPLLAKLRRRPENQHTKLLNRYFAARKLGPAGLRHAALNDVAARLLVQSKLKSGKLSVSDYRALAISMLPDDALPRRFNKRKKAAKGSAAEPVAQTATSELTRGSSQSAGG